METRLVWFALNSKDARPYVSTLCRMGLSKKDGLFFDTVNFCYYEAAAT